jgi:hypothetical protein
MPQPLALQFPQHGPFVHRLCRMFLDSPQGLLKELEMWGGVPLRFHWGDGGSQIAENGPDAVILPADGLTYSTHNIESGITGTVISLPRRTWSLMPILSPLLSLRRGW